jgi:hypothetical protein
MKSREIHQKRKERKVIKKALILLAVLVILASPIFAGVVKKSKSDVMFKGFGHFTSLQSEKLTAEQKWMDSKNEFKGQGFLGGLAGKTFLRSGDMGEIIDLPALSIYNLDHKKKEYTVSPIQKLSEETKGEMPGSKEEKEEVGAAESDIKIIRSEIKVEDTGESKVINNFPTNRYAVTWVTEWENTRTGEKGSNQLLTSVCTTPLSDVIKKAEEEEMKFSSEYLKKLGVDMNQMQQEILGTNWLSMLNTMNKAKGRPSEDFSKFANEMKKIKGYPVVVDGKYYAKSEKPQGEKEEEGSKSAKGLFGGLAKKVLKKKSTEGESQEPSLSYYTEIMELSLADLGASDFQVPADYKKKG